MPRPANPPMPVVPVSIASERKKKGPGRPAAPSQPPIPQEILDAMSDIERQHFDFFIVAYEQAFERKYGKLTPTAQINITQAALDYVHLWRLQAEQMRSGTLVSQARQHPGVQVRAWLTAIGLCEKDLEQPQKPDEKAAARAALLGLATS